jgi:hypothetical protein
VSPLSTPAVVATHEIASRSQQSRAKAMHTRSLDVFLDAPLSLAAGLSARRPAVTLYRAIGLYQPGLVA